MQVWGQETVAKFYGGELHLRLEGDRSKDDYIKDLNGIIERGRDMRPVMDKIGKYLMGSTLRTFEAEGRPRKWQPLQPATIADRQRKGFGPGPILVRSGALKSSLTSAGDSNQILKVGSKSLQYGSKLIYFRTHQHGDSNRNIPARVMLILQKQDRSQIGSIISRYLKSGAV